MKKQLSYIDSVHRSGTIWNISVMILLLAFPLTVAALFGAAPDWGALVVGLIATAPMSSTIATVVRNSFSDAGARLPSQASTPIAKAMSVAAGIAQPRNAAGSDQLIAT